MSASSIGRLVGGLVGFGLISSACGGTSKTTKSDNATEVRCTANAALCDGSIATQCNAEGSGPQPGGVDCADTKQFCVAGMCQNTLCNGGTKSCQNGDVYLCASDGSSLSMFEDCRNDELCNGESGRCVARLCQPGRSLCSGTRVLTCNELGNGWLAESTDCVAMGKACVAGHCEAPVCVASTSFCRDGNLYQCDPAGTTSTLSAVCRPGFEHCEVTPAGLSAFCVPDVCVAGNKLCAGNVIKVCNADGSLPEAGTACAKDEFCENAQCKPTSCALGTRYCDGKNVITCQPNGPIVYRECSPDEACLAVVPNADQSFPDLVSCVPTPCVAGETTCVQNQIGTCEDDGTSLGVVTNDCAASGQVCTASATCAASVSDTLGLDENAVALQGSPYVGNMIEVRSSRKLTELQMALVFTSPRDLRWMVFEQVGDEFVLRAETMTTSASSSGFVSSGPLNYPLDVGKRYALGVMMPSDCIGYNDTQPVGGNPSFGSVLGSVMAFSDDSFSVASSFVAYTVSYMKVTTESP